jgi:hypothetical protein
MSTEQDINDVQASFASIYLGGIPCMLNDDGAFLSFICCFTATEALGGFLIPKSSVPKGEGVNAFRFKEFIRKYFPVPYRSQADDLWKLRNAMVHAFSPDDFALAHHQGHLHLKTVNGQRVLNAEDFYASLVLATKSYFDELRGDDAMMKAFSERKQEAGNGVATVVQATASRRES